MDRRFGLGQYIISNMNWLNDADNTARKGLTPKLLLSRALSVVTHIAKRRKRRRVCALMVDVRPSQRQVVCADVYCPPPPYTLGVRWGGWAPFPPRVRVGCH